MDKNTWSGAVESVGHAARAWTETPFPYLLGFGVAMALIFAAEKWDGHFYNRTGCVQLKEVKQKLYKVDTCSGEIEAFKIEEAKPE